MLADAHGHCSVEVHATRQARVRVSRRREAGLHWALPSLKFKSGIRVFQRDKLPLEVIMDAVRSNQMWISRISGGCIGRGVCTMRL